MNGRQVFRRVTTALVAGTFAALIPATAHAQSEGIKVHGRWVIEVKNPDGSVADRREFNNALSPGGHTTLAIVLGRIGVVSRWDVIFGPQTGGVSPCQGGTGAPFGSWCRILESAATNPTGGTAESRDLVVTSSNGMSVSMTGTITALVDGSIGRVATRLGTCGASQLVAECSGAGSADFFSDTSLGGTGRPPVVTVVAGQIIKLTVTFTFS